MRVPTIVAVAACLFAHPLPARAEPQGHYCNLHVFTPAQREHQSALTAALASAITQRQELDDGYAFAFEGKAAGAVGEWLDGERRCCPTLRFQLSFEPRGGQALLQATGSAGAKAFIAEEFAALLNGPVVPRVPGAQSP